MPEDGLERLREARLRSSLVPSDIPGVPDHVSLWGLLIPIRRAFDQYVNLRPVRLLRGIDSPLRRIPQSGIEFVVVRENSEGEYSEIGGRLFRGTDRRRWRSRSRCSPATASRASSPTRLRARPETVAANVTSATKSNGIIHTMPFWDELVREVVARRLPRMSRLTSVTSTHSPPRSCSTPQRFDVVVALQPLRRHPHRSGRRHHRQHRDRAVGQSQSGAPVPVDVRAGARLRAGHRRPGKANPMGQVWAGAMMLDHLGHKDAAEGVVSAIERVLGETEIRTPDLKGTATTKDVTQATLRHPEESPRSEDARK